MFSLILSKNWTDVLRQDTMNAVNLLMVQGKIDPETNYKFITDEKGRPRVILWLDFGDGPFAVAQADPADLIVAAGSLGVVRGKSDNL